MQWARTCPIGPCEYGRLLLSWLSYLLASTLSAPSGAWTMVRDLWEVKSKTSTLTGILCNIESKEEGVKGGENSDNKNHMVA